MKAYISDREARCEAFRTQDTYEWGYSAEHEAERILSETEPGSGEWPDYRTVAELGTYMRESLVEALAAFTAEPSTL